MITRYDPFREALSLRRAMDQLFEQSVVPPGLLPGGPSLIAPMDVIETPNGYEVDVALPGVRPEDIELTVDQNSLTIRGRYSHQDERQNQSQSQQQGGIDTNKIQTKFQNGILTIMVPVSEESRPKRIGITGSESQPQQVPVGAGQQQG